MFTNQELAELQRRALAPNAYRREVFHPKLDAELRMIEAAAVPDPESGGERLLRPHVLIPHHSTESLARALHIADRHSIPKEKVYLILE